MPSLARLDKKRPHKTIVHYSNGSKTHVQDGQEFSDSGLMIVNAAALAGKYLCPSCSYDTMKAQELYAHLTNLHHVDDDYLKVAEVYVENVNRGLPADEGINWKTLELTRTPAQTARDEKDAAKAAPKDEPVKAGPEAAQKIAVGGVIDEETGRVVFPCPNCSSRFFHQPGLAAHGRIHKGKK